MQIGQSKFIAGTKTLLFIYAISFNKFNLHIYKIYKMHFKNYTQIKL